jgi:hypothetical protein
LKLSNTVRLSFVAVVLLAVAVAVGLAACGGGDDANKLLRETFSGKKNVRSANLDLGLTLNAQGSSQLSGPVQIRLSGPFQSQGAGNVPKFDFNLLLNASQVNVNAGAVSTGDRGYLKLRGAAYALPPNIFNAFKQSFVNAQSQQNGRNQSLRAYGINPLDWVKDAKVKDDEDVAGAPTKHISAGIKVGKLLTDVNRLLQKAGSLGVSQTRQLPSSITPQQQKRVEQAIKGASFDVWTGKDDRILRRMNVKLSFDVPPGQQQGTGGLKSGNLALNLQLANLNQSQTISAPGNARPFAELSRQLRGLGALGALSGASGAGSGGASGGSSGGAPGASPGSPGAAPGPPGGAGSSAAAQRYLQCVQRAGGDVAKAQKCASLLSSG